MLKFWASRSRRRISFALGALLLYGVAKGLLITRRADFAVGSKNFTESLILGELYALALEKGGFHVERKFNLGGTLVAHEALKRGEIDLYPEYTGTGLLDVLHLPADTPRERIAEIVTQAYSDRWDLRWLRPSRANDSQGLVVRRDVAERYGVRTLSQLAAAAPNLVLAATAEFEEREDGLKGLQKFYGGFQFRESRLYENGLKYRVVLAHQADVTVAFTTEGGLTDPNLVLLEDDRGFWPPYHVAPVMRGELARRSPLAVTLADRVSALLDSKVLQELNAEVDLRHQDYRNVAKEFLRSKGVL